jgi:hypothetical protein
MATPTTAVGTVGTARPVAVPPKRGSWRRPTPSPVIPQQRRPDGDPVSARPAVPPRPRHARRLIWLVAASAAVLTGVAVSVVLVQPSVDRAVSNSTGLADLMVPPGLTAAEPVPEQAFSLAEVLVAPTDLEELLLRPGLQASSPAPVSASEPSWWVVLESALKQPQ